MPKLLPRPIVGAQWICFICLCTTTLTVWASYMTELELEPATILEVKPDYENSVSGPTFGVAPGVHPEYDQDYGFDYSREYSPQLSTIYNRYLRRPTPLDNECGHGNEIDWPHAEDVHMEEEDYEKAFHAAGKGVEDYERANQEYLANDPRGLNFSAFVYVSTLHSKYNELLTENLKTRKCMSRKQVALHMPMVKIPPNPWKKGKYCEFQSSKSLQVECDPHTPYRRIDGKCSNLKQSNFGSSFHCHRRLLPPDYSDGIYQIRMGVDQRPLPSPRLVTQLMMPDLDLNDPGLSAMHLAWGQMLVHDTFRTIQHLGLAIDCCSLINPPRNQRTPMRPMGPMNPMNPMSLFNPMKPMTSYRRIPYAGINQPPVPHPECLPITNFPPNKATEMFQQICLNTVRSITCNTCSLGPRNQLNVATQVIDLSHIYGGNLLNNTGYLRTFIGGQLMTSFALNGEIIMPAMLTAADSDTLDLTPCNPPLKNPMNVGCFRTGDGIRGNQNPLIASLQSMALRRHNGHAAALSLINPHWDDERLFQEARRLLIAEITKIHYDEYAQSILGDRLMKYFHLNVREYGYTKFNPHVDPSTIQAAGVAALRFGHSQVRSIYRLNYKPYNQKTSFMLKDRFFNMLEVWTGQVTPVVEGLLSDASKNIDPYAVIDLKDFLFFNPRTPSVVDLKSININRGRDHGVPGYVYYLQYCLGYEVKSWKDLEKFMPASKVKSLRKIYRHYKDIDLFLAGLLEYHLKGAKVGPTYACLIGMQFYHWKYGDRFYFEHGGEAGTFVPEQLNEIRKKTTLANYICKTTNLKKIQVNAFWESSPHNPKVDCTSYPEIDYTLWQEAHYK